MFTLIMDGQWTIIGRKKNVEEIEKMSKDAGKKYQLCQDCNYRMWIYRKKLYRMQQA